MASSSGWRPRFLGRSANAVPLSVRTVCSWQGKTSTTSRRKAAPLAFGYPIDGEKHEQLALRQAQLADVDVHVTDPGFGKALALGRLLLAFGQAGDAMTDEATVESTAREPGDGFAQAAQDVVQGQQRAAAELDHDGLLGLGEHRAVRPRWSHRRVGG